MKIVDVNYLDIILQIYTSNNNNNNVCLCATFLAQSVHHSSRCICQVLGVSLNMACSDHCMFWAACTLVGHFGFFRSAEFTVPSLASFSASLHLTVQDIAVDGVSAPYCMRVWIKDVRAKIFLH